MSSITKKWTEEDFRKELRRLDQYVKDTKGIVLSGGELPITFSERARCELGAYYPREKKFRFSLAFFNSNIPEACAIDVIRHEYAHYYSHVIFGEHGHGATFKSVCGIVGANPSRLYTDSYEKFERNKEERQNRVYESTAKIGQDVLHPMFGEGKIIKVENKKSTAMLTIDFGKFGVKTISESWLRTNGVI